MGCIKTLIGLHTTHMNDKLILPMLVGKSSERVLSSPNYLFEFKFDGIRMLYSNLNGSILYTRNLIDRTSRYPMLMQELAALPEGVVLDGEIVAISKGRQDFYALLSHNSGEGEERDEVDIFYIIFDILYCNGRSTMEMPLLERKELLKAVVTDGDRVKRAVSYDSGVELFESAERACMEGVVAKLKSGKYYAGKRSDNMVKVKCASYKRREEQ